MEQGILDKLKMVKWSDLLHIFKSVILNLLNEIASDTSANADTEISG